MNEILHSENYKYYLSHYDGFAFVVLEDEDSEEGEKEGDSQGDPQEVEQSQATEDIGEGAEPTAEPTAEPAETAEPSATPADYTEILESLEGIEETLTEVRDVGSVCVCAIGFCIGTIIIKNLFEELMKL